MLSLVPLARASSEAASAGPGSRVQRTQARLGALPFVERLGARGDGAARYTTSTPEAVVSVEADGRLRYGLRPHPGESVAPILSERPLGECDIAPRGVEPTPLRVSRFGGAQGDERNCATHSRIDLGEPWPGITISLRREGARIEKIFTLAPGADSGVIRMAVEGARELAITDAGSLLLLADTGSLGMTRPVAFQHVDGRNVPVEVAYRTMGMSYGFALGPSDPALPVIIDPFLQATFAGGSLNDAIEAMDIHPVSGDVYVGGMTLSNDLPATTGGAFPTWKAAADAFIARFSADLTTLLQATYFSHPSSNSFESIHSLGIHPGNGDVYIGGSAGFPPPGLAGGAQTSHGGFFVSRLSADLSTLVQTTSLGTTISNETTPFRMAFFPGALGDVLVAGRIQGGGYTPLTGGAQGVHGDAPGFDGYVLSLSADLTAFTGGTYLGGDNLDEIHGLGVHPINGDVYVAGATMGTFPAAAEGFQSVRAGSSDTFVVRLNPALTSIVAGTLFGGPGVETMFNNTTPAGGLAFHPGGDVYLMGQTYADGLPEAATGAIPTYQGLAGLDVFVARLSPDLGSVVRSTYFPGVQGEFRGSEIAVEPNGSSIWVSGWTQAVVPLPSSMGAPQPANAGGIDGGFDGFVTRISGDLTSVHISTYVGGPKYEDLRAMVRHPATGEIYIAGSTQSDVGFPAIAGGGDATFAGHDEGWILRLTMEKPPCPGDCDGSLIVTTTELDIVKEIAIGLRPLSDCPSADANASGTVTVTDLVSATIALLSGCP